MKKQIQENRLYSFAELVEVLDIEESHVMEVLGKDCMLCYAPKDKDDVHKKMGIPESSRNSNVFKISDLISKIKSDEN